MIDWLLRIAVNRWPASLRETRAREWAAELHHLGHWGRLRFAWSLAMSPPVNEDGVPMGWRETVPAFGRGLQPLLALFGAGLMCMLAATWLPRLGSGIVSGRSGGHLPDHEFNWVANAVSVAILALAALAMFFAGRWLGARMHIQWAHRGRWSRIGSAVLAPAVIACGAEAFRLLQEWEDRRFGTPIYVPDIGAGMVFWAACFALIAAVVVKTGRVWIAAVGTLAVLDLTAIIAGWRPAQEIALDPASAPLWFPLALLDLETSGVAFGHIEQGLIASEVVARGAAMPVRVCLIASLFVLGYGLAAAKASPRAVPVSGLGRAAVPRPALPGLLIGSAGLVLWVYGLTALTGALNHVTDEVGEHHIWAHEIRQAAIVAMVTGFALAVAGRGAVVFPAAVALAGLWTVDSVFDAVDAASAGAGVLAAGLGTIVLYGAWQLARLFAVDETAVRRSLAGFGVFAAMCAPAVAFHRPDWETLLPDGFYIASAVAVGLVTFAAMVCAAGVRGRPMWVAAGSVAVAAGAASVLGLYFAAASAPLVVIAVWFMWPRGSAWKRALAMLGALIAAIPVAYVQIFTALIFGGALMNAAGYSFPADGIPFLPGSVLVGTVAGIIVAAKIAPRPDIADTVLEPAHTG